MTCDSLKPSRTRWRKTNKDGKREGDFREVPTIVKEKLPRKPCKIQRQLFTTCSKQKRLGVDGGRTFWRRCSALQNLFLRAESFLLWKLWLTTKTIVFAPLYRETLPKVSEHILDDRNQRVPCFKLLSLLMIRYRPSCLLKEWKWIAEFTNI